MTAHARPEPEPATLYVTDKQIRAWLGIGEGTWAGAVHVLEAQGLPKRDPLFGKKRYWPKVREFFDRRNGLGNYGVSRPDGKEKLEAL